ncbi:MAG: acyl-CoA reductase [Chlorobi bacterium]|nr:acyl-CoA reductase [Chlorobiota bacterium]
MNLQQRINAFVKLGDAILKNKEALKKGKQNPWFTESNLEYALTEIANSLSKENLEKWTSMYPALQNEQEAKRLGVITAGNIPLVGFHDFLSVLISGNKFVGKLSSKDDKLMPAVIKLLLDIEPRFKDYIFISENKLENFDAVIATGSNNSARYFEYYFGKYPHIIRKNRNSVAVLTGNETDEELQLLADDIFLYFGLGCRSVSKLFLPDNYDLDNIFRNSLKHKEIINHNKYANNYDYNRAIYLMNLTEFKDNGIMLMKEDINMASPVSVVYFENYSKIETVKQRLEIEKDNIQCIVANEGVISNAIPFGESQKPQLWDYADNVDTIEFLLSL